jgi:iron complex outermembrane receptor protein
MRNFLTILIAITTFSFSSQAQNSIGKVSGQVIDGNTKTIEAATITLLRAKDSSVAKISAANKNGDFVFENVIEGKYFVSITAVGHTKGFSESFEITPANTTVIINKI